MRKFWAFFRFFFQERLMYRVDMLVYSCASALFPLIGLAIWVTASNYGTLPYSKPEIIIYFAVAVYVGIATEMWQSWFMNEDIHNGNFSKLLVKPQSIFNRYITENLSDKVYKMSMITLIAPLFYFLMPKEVINSLTFTPLSILLFIVALIFGYLIVFLMELTIGLSSVWFYDIGFIKSFLDVANTFFAGKFVPLTFLPIFFSTIAVFLPFRYSVAFPIELLLNKLTFNQIITGFSIELIWLGVIVLLYKKVKDLFNKSYKGYGG